MNQRQRKQRLKEINKINKEKNVETSLEVVANNTEFKKIHPIQYSENITNFIIFSLISFVIFLLEKLFNSKATAELVKALNEHSAPNSIAILLVLLVLSATVYKFFNKKELNPTKIIYKVIFSPLNFAFNLASIWIPISVISNYFNNTEIPYNHIILIFTAYMSIIFLYNTEQDKETNKEIAICGLFPLVIFYIGFILTLIYRFCFS